MKISLAIVILVIVTVQTLPRDLSVNRELNDEWEAFKTKFGKTYEVVEEYTRRLIWEENLKYIQEHNIRYNLGQHTFFLGVNQFTDLSHKEFLVKYLRLKQPEQRNDTVKFMTPLNVGILPDTVDWVKKGFVTPVKNQGNSCGSCWAFSATGSLEGQYFRKNRRLVSFSEQQLVDCNTDNDGCEGGYKEKAFDYIKDFGIEREQDYPYIYKDGHCEYNKAKVVTKVSGYRYIESRSEEDLELAVATQGPISVAIDASQPSFTEYSGGVYNEPSCSSSSLDHEVLVVGYGVEEGQKYWLVKNSWNATWGLKGYIKMSKDQDNQCGIATSASFPTL